jgi:hypothetical protein
VVEAAVAAGQPLAQVVLAVAVLVVKVSLHKQHRRRVLPILEVAAEAGLLTTVVAVVQQVVQEL